MLLPLVQDASEPAFTTTTAQPIPYTEPIRHMVFGSLSAVRVTLMDMQERGYAKLSDWSKPIYIDKADEVMAVLNKRVEV